MNLAKAQIILEKINTLYKNISIDDHVSAIERDLMLAYIRNLYETFLEESTTTQTTTKANAQDTPTPRPKARVVEIPDSIKDYATPTDKTPPAPPKVAAPPKVTDIPKKMPAPETPTKAPKTADTEEHNVLFEQKEAKELSEKLGLSPIRDLKTAMGLNEKILTINELFGGDQKAFDAALNDLNRLNSFEEAKEYMSNNLAAKYDWANSQKKKKAQVFIKLVRRRYI